MPVDLLADLGRALVDLVASAVTRLAGRLADLLARLLADLLRLLLRLLLDAAVATVRCGGGAGIGGSRHGSAPFSLDWVGGRSRGGGPGPPAVRRIGASGQQPGAAPLSRARRRPQADTREIGCAAQRLDSGLIHDRSGLRATREGDAKGLQHTLTIGENRHHGIRHFRDPPISSAYAPSRRRGGAIAEMPVRSRPTISDWIESVPSNVKTASMSAWWRATWFSSRIPLPPRMSRASATTARAFAAWFIFASDAIAGVRRPSSCNELRRRHRSCIAVISAAIRLSLSWTSW